MLLRNSKKLAPRKGITLLEVMVSLLIFFISISVITNMFDTANRTSLRAQIISKASLYAETKMDEIAAGALPLSSVSNQVISEVGEPWYYSVSIIAEDWTSVTDPTGSSVTGLNTVHVTVSYQPSGTDPIEHTVSRVMLNPSFRQPLSGGG